MRQLTLTHEQDPKVLELILELGEATHSLLGVGNPPFSGWKPWSQVGGADPNSYCFKPPKQALKITAWWSHFTHIIRESQWCHPKADYTRGNILSNFTWQFFMGHVAWSLSHWEWETDFYRDILDRLWALCLTWLPVDGNIIQSCLATLL